MICLLKSPQAIMRCLKVLIGASQTQTEGQVTCQLRSSCSKGSFVGRGHGRHMGLCNVHKHRHDKA